MNYHLNETNKNFIDNGCEQTLNDVKYIAKSRKNLIFLGSPHENGFIYKSDGDMNIMEVR